MGDASGVRYVAEIAHVREVSLWGRADLDYWKERLGGLELHPAESAWQARVLVSAVSSRFKGMAFRELSVSVVVSREAGGAGRDGFYLLHAFNSLRFFAFVERVCFGTPYFHGSIDVEPRVPASLGVSCRGESLLSAGMGVEVHEPLADADDVWEGPIYLPPRQVGGRCERLFVARLAGVARRYPFVDGRDRLTITPSPDAPVFQQLLDSRFAPDEWLVREDGNHAKSKTVRRAGAGAF